MNKKEEFSMDDLDAILAEFSSDSAAPPKTPEPRYEPEQPRRTPEPRYEPEQPRRTPEPRYEPEQPRRTPTPRYEPEKTRPAPMPRREPEVVRAPEKSQVPARRAVPTPPPAGGRLRAGLSTLLFALMTVVALLLVSVYVHPGSGSANAAAATRLRLADKLDTYMNNAASDALSELTHIRKIYKIGENDTVAPMPDASRYGTVEVADAAKVLDVIQQARDSGLLEGQEVVFDPEAEFYYDSNIQYYCDETILVICWKELIDGNTCSCVEVKVADASQLRRKIADDAYGSSNKYYASSMAKQVNAVVAMNADFYQFRDFGIVAYQRKLYRFSDSNYSGKFSMYNCIDNCFVTAQGDFLFMRKGDTTTAEAVQQFIDDNDVLFTIAFGPVLVDDGVVQTCDWYPAGEPTTGYSRAGIGQLDKLHYFYMSLNHSPEKSARWTVNEFAQHIADKGVYDAYGLDGGQTSEIVFQGVPYNYIDFGSERAVSDIIYFATALPTEEVEG